MFALGARWLGVLCVGWLLVSVLLGIYGVWAHHRKLEAQVDHPTRGTDPARLVHYLPHLDGVVQCEWAEGLTRTDNPWHPYRRSFSGYLKLTPDVTTQVDRQAIENGIPCERVTRRWDTRLLAQTPFAWYEIVAPPAFRPGPAHHGRFFYEKTNGVILFIVVPAPD